MNESFESQLHLLEDHRRHLQAMASFLENNRESYRHQIATLEGHGFAKEYIERLREKYADYSRMIDGLADQLKRGENELALQEGQLRALIQSARAG
jgi:chromosome segregation ATPase